jgi:phage gpG-like protein
MMTNTMQNEISMADRFVARREQMLRELASDLAELVRTGDLTAEQANEWYNAKADQWTIEA